MKCSLCDSHFCVGADVQSERAQWCSTVSLHTVQRGVIAILTHCVGDVIPHGKCISASVWFEMQRHFQSSSESGIKKRPDHGIAWVSVLVRLAGRVP